MQGVFWSCRWGGGAAGGSSGGRLGDGDSSEEEEEAAELGRGEELRRERLNALVKRNLTAILLEVTDAMFGAFAPYFFSPFPRHLLPGSIVQNCRYVAKLISGEVTPLFSAVNLIDFYCFLCSADEVAMEVSKAAQRQTAPQDSTGADEQKPELGGAVVLTREGTTGLQTLIAVANL